MLIFGGMALLALIMLAATLNNLRLDPGQPIQLPDLAPDVWSPDVPEGWQRILLAVFRYVMIAAWFGLPIWLAYLILSKEARKRFLRDLMAILPILILLLVLSNGQPRQPEAEEVAPSLFEMGEIDLGAGQEYAPLPEYQAPGDWVTTVTTIALSVTLTLAVAGLAFALFRRARMAKSTPLDRIRKEAQNALDAIEAGGDLRDVILRCYAQMIAALKQYRNIQRDQDMTPHEFEAYLTGRGLPKGPVRQLTQLFEQVRYGGQMPGRQDERAAINSLTAIVAACEKNVE